MVPDNLSYSHQYTLTVTLWSIPDNLSYSHQCCHQYTLTVTLWSLITCLTVTSTH